MQQLPRIARLIGVFDASTGRATRYLVALGLVVAVAGLLQVLYAITPRALTFPMFYPTVLIAAVFCGWRPAMLTVAGILAWLVLTPPAGLWATTPRPETAFNLTLFALVASFVAAIGAALRASLLARLADSATLAASEETLRMAVEAGELGL